MAWSVKYTKTAKRRLRKLDRQVARCIVDYMDDRVATTGDPCRRGKALRGPLGTLWRYRVGDYRVICEIREKSLAVLVLKVGHCGEVYR